MQMVSSNSSYILFCFARKFLSCLSWFESTSGYSFTNKGHRILVILPQLAYQRYQCTLLQSLSFVGTSAGRMRPHRVEEFVPLCYVVGYNTVTNLESILNTRKLHDGSYSIPHSYFTFLFTGNKNIFSFVFILNFLYALQCLGMAPRPVLCRRWYTMIRQGQVMQPPTPRRR